MYDYDMLANLITQKVQMFILPCLIQFIHMVPPWKKKVYTSYNKSMESALHVTM